MRKTLADGEPNYRLVWRESEFSVCVIWCVSVPNFSKHFKWQQDCYSYSLTNSTCLKKHAMQHVKHVTEESSFVLSSASSWICNSSTLCFLFPCAVAPVGTEAGVYTQVKQDHLQPLNVCWSVIHSSVVMVLCSSVLCLLYWQSEKNNRKTNRLYDFS